ncbi:heavy metal translocating P-type ATPase [Rhodobacter maris]|uniref:P-type Zn(2+) transporter n=1 Tax=Rhodobacter maris TaxID=446682 RepID=A0A285RZD7_9RHOB|nr:heavy metal translocating P-type ATPase [Rhodobacter maris]SOB99942.1 Cd2+/Zn2+-exporting ATPase [Rhodobacter maris]
MTAHSQVESFEWQVGGMDCAACAGKIRAAVSGLPGVAEVEIALMDERLRLRLAPGGVGREEVERIVTRLGYQMTRRSGPSDPPPVLRAGTSACACGDGGCGGTSKAALAPAARQGWARGPKARALVLAGGALAAGWAVGAVAPGFERLAFSLAAAVALVPVGRRALALLRSGQPFTIEMLMVIAALGALVIGAAAEAATVLFLFAVGEVLEGLAARRARDGIRALVRQMPTVALLEHGTHAHEVAAETLRPGQIIHLRPGDRAAVDAVIVEGVSGLDESAVTGESLPVTRGPGAAVPAGAINTEALLRLRVTRPAAESTLARIAQMVAEAEASRAPVERFIDRFSRWYMPLVVVLAGGVAAVPPLAWGADGATWVYRGLALLLVGCPCALVISVPAAMAAALATGARQGLLIRGGAVLEALAKLRHVALDKTGTLTLGRPEVTDLLPRAGVEETELLRLAAAVEAGSSHPLAKAIVARAAKAGLVPPAVRAARTLPGVGAEAELGGQVLRLAAPRLPDAACAALQAEGKTVVELTCDGEALGRLALRDAPRPEAAEALADLARLGLSAQMLTGDAAAPAQAVARPLRLEHAAGLLPEDKLARIRALSAQGGVMMVGDGINDAPALGAADVGVAIGAGADVAIETADAVLARDRLTDLPALIRLGRATMKNVRQNLAIALGLKALFLVTSVAGISGLWMAVLADTGATVLVTANALRLLRFDPRRARAAPGGGGSEPFR